MIKICALGNFTIKDTETGVCLEDENLRSDMIKKLVTYLVMHRSHPVPIQDLFGALWQEDESENPAGALKNLTYRLRVTLKKYFGDTDFVLTCSGAYAWNPQVETEVDAEVFEALVKKAKAIKEPEEAIKTFEEACALFRGEFLEKCADRHWMVTSATYYHSMYLTAVKKLSALYLKTERYSEAENLCSHALRFDDVDEQIYCDLIRSLLKQGKNDLAVKNFDHAKKVLQEALGIKGTKKFAEVEKDILKINKGSAVENLDIIQSEIVEQEDADGAYFVGYPVFKELYRIEARKMSRIGEAAHILLLTAELGEGVDDSNERAKRFLIKQAMGQLEKAIRRSLRMGDLAARYSDTQFVVFLPTCTYESTKVIAKRVITDFKSLQRSKRVVVRSQMEQVTRKASRLVE
ncbi:MAG: diguanylate cyclase [Lachnospiraceae bacterium]|nr:diguanylate cyclase [Lachnospiraceae bacterium]